MVGRRVALCVLVGVLLGVGNGWTSEDLVAGPGFQDSFESGYLGPAWSCQSSRPENPRFSLRITDQFGAASGTQSLVLGYSGVDYIRMELTLAVDLAGCDHATLSFQAKDYGDEPHDLPSWSPFTGSMDADYLAASPDGVTWYPLLPLTSASGTLDSAWKRITVPLHQALAPWGIPVAAIHYLRFCQYDNSRPNLPADPDGIGLDDVTLSAPASFGDAPEPFPVTRAENGAIHLPSSGPFLGSPPVFSETGAHDPLADAMASDDGIHLSGLMIPGETVSFEITASGEGWLRGWVDFNGDGDWTDPGEQVFTSIWHPGGTLVLPVNVPAEATPGHLAVARFRLSSLDGLDYGGIAPDGEVEDYLFPIYPRTPELAVPPSPVLTSPVTISWNSVNATTYTAESATQPDFQGVNGEMVHTADLFANFPFTGDQVLWFRVRGSVAAARRAETGSLPLPTPGITFSDTQVAPGLGVSLGGPGLRLETIGGPSENDRVTFTNGGRANVYRVGPSDCRLLGWEVFLGCLAATTVELAVYRGGATVSDPWTKIWSRQVSLDPGIRWIPSEPVNLTLAANGLYAFAVTSPGTADIFSSARVLNNPAWGTLTHRAGLDGFPGTFSIFSSTTRPYHMRFRSADPGTFSGAGFALIPVSPPPASQGWKSLDMDTEIPAGTTLLADILDPDTLEPLPDLVDLTDAIDMTRLSLDHFVLRIRMNTNNPVVTPVLRGIHLSWYRDPPGAFTGAWSEARSVYADLNPPRLVTLTRLDPSPTRANAARYRAVFSEPVTGPGLAPPYAGWIPQGIASAWITSVSPAADPNAWDITIALPEGVGGLLGLRRLAGPDIVDTVGRELAETGDAADLYDIDRIRPWVTSFSRMDPSPTNAPVVRWRVFFSEPVVHVPLFEGSDGWIISGSAGGTLLGVEAFDDYCDVLVRPGTADGTLGITLAASSSLTDRAGWPMALNAVANIGYQVSHLRLIRAPSPEIVITAGGRLALEVEAVGGSQPRQYLWNWSPDGVSWRNIPGADQPRLVLDYVTPSDDGWYLCQVTDPWETVASAPARVRVEGELSAGGIPVASITALAILVLTGIGRFTFFPPNSKPAQRSLRNS